MNPDIASQARQIAGEILLGRLRRAHLPVDRPELSFRCEAGPPRPYPGGFEARVKTWRHWSDALVELNAQTGELMGIVIARHCDPPNEKEMTQEQALAAVGQAVTIPDDSKLISFGHYDYVPGRKVARLEWKHVHQGRDVDGDYLVVVVHPKTLRVIEYRCKWRAIKIAE